MKKITNLLFALMLASVLTACGGGGGDSGGGGSDTVPAASVPTRDMRPSLAPDVAQLSIASSITTFESPVATATPGKDIAVIDTRANGANTIFAVDASGEVILVGTDSAGSSMGVDSTAQYLVWMGLLVSDNSAEFPAAQVRPFIASAASYPALVSAITAELAKGIPISQSDILGDYIWAVVNDAQRLYAQSLPAISATTVRPMAAGGNIPELDYFVINQAADEKLWVSGDSAQSVMLNNRTFLFWHVSAKNLETGQNVADVPLVAPLKSTTAQLFANYAGSESKTVIATASHTELSIEQNTKTINANATLLMTRSLFGIIEVASAALNVSSANKEKCVINVTKVFTTKAEFASFIAQPSWVAFIDLLKSVDKFDVIQRSLECSDFTAITNSQIYKTIDKLFKPLRAARSGNAAFGTLEQLVRYSTQSYTFELCRHAGAVKPCIRRLSGPAEKTVRIAEAAIVNVSAFADFDVPIVNPPSLSVRSTNPEIFTVDPINIGGQISIKGVATGTAQLEVTDLVTGVALLPAILVHVDAGAFTKISASGQDLPADAPTWSCVRHNATGLLWEAHVTRQTPPHLCEHNTFVADCTGYTNFGGGRAYDASTVPATVGSLCGKMGWRLPTEVEGRALGEERLSPTDHYHMYQVYFGEDDKADFIWTSSPMVGEPDYAWAIDFRYGMVEPFYRYYGRGGVRLVAGP